MNRTVRFITVLSGTHYYLFLYWQLNMKLCIWISVCFTSEYLFIIKAWTRLCCTILTNDLLDLSVVSWRISKEKEHLIGIKVFCTVSDYFWTSERWLTGVYRPGNNHRLCKSALHLCKSCKSIYIFSPFPKWHGALIHTRIGKWQRVSIKWWKTRLTHLPLNPAINKDLLISIH